MCKSFNYISFNDFYLERFTGLHDKSVIKQVVDYVESISPIKKTNPKVFSASTKRSIKEEHEMRHQGFCEICDGLIYLSSTETDHRIAKSAGGYGVLENGTLVHPMCNRFKSDRHLEEVRADLFD